MADTAIKTIKLVLKQHSEAEMGERAKAFSDLMQARRTVRDFFRQASVKTSDRGLFNHRR